MSPPPIAPDQPLVPLPCDVIRVSGPDAVAFLQGQLSQDVATLPVGSRCWSLLLQPTGKVDAWLGVTREADDALLLDVDAGWGEAVVARLQRFKLRTKADLDVVRGAAVVAPLAALADRRVLVDGAPDDLVAPDAATLTAARIEQGLPAMGAELTADTIPAEMGQWLIDASVSFTKGCYTGQELVARIDSRGGNVPRHLRHLTVEGDRVPPPGSTLRHEGSEVGTVTSAARSSQGVLALAVVHRSVEPPAVVTVCAADGSEDQATVGAVDLPPVAG